jgi:vancomycin aglycone glucosyltransferase
MRVVLSVVGTRGDVQPVFALALRVREHGHEAHLCVPPNFTAWAAELGFTATSVGIEMRAPRPGVPTAKPIPDLIADQFDAILGAAQHCDVILGANAHQYAAPSIAELRDVPYVNALYAPTALPSEDNVRSWNERARERVNANRARLGLSPIDDVLRYVVTDHPWLAADRTLAPAPSIAGLRIVQTGAWMFDDTRPLPGDLEAFLDAGEPPVYFGFGSMPVAEGTSRVLIEAARAAGRRAILSRGWGGLTLVDDAPDCIGIDEVNHRALFGRVASVVHHGGAGTTHAAARAGVPQVIVPMFGDQPFWASRVRALGAGASILPAELSVERLAAALHEVTQPPTTERAETLARQIAPDGANVAARLLSDLMAL